MKETGIIMSGSHPQDILESRKTQARRVIKLKPHPTGREWHAPFYDSLTGAWVFTAGFGLAMRQQHIKCPYGQPGDRLWVRETFCYIQGGGEPHDFGIWYKANGDYNWWRDNGGLMNYPINERTRPSIHMPRWASRILLEITEVRAERLQDISEEAARAEGASPAVWHLLPNGGGEDISRLPGWPDQRASYKNGFANLWDSLNAKKGHGWDKNEWVWPISFKEVSV